MPLHGGGRLVLVVWLCGLFVFQAKELWALADFCYFCFYHADMSFEGFGNRGERNLLIYFQFKMFVICVGIAGIAYCAYFLVPAGTE
jgi:hypothetical protein